MARALRIVDDSAASSALTKTTNLRKKIGWHVAQKEPHATVLTIGPEDAEDILERNQGADWRNRPTSAAKLKKYTAAMSAGWRVTGETVIFSKTGRLLNGQHRLLACMRSGKPFTTFVAFGVDDDAFAEMDQPLVRTGSDIFAIHGETQTKRLAAASAWVWRYCNNGIASHTAKLTPAELYDHYKNEHPGLAESLHVASWFGAEKIAAPAMMVALHYLCAQRDRVAADAFFKAVATGVGLNSSRSPAFKLRDRLLKARIDSARLNEHTAAAVTVKAWNAMRTKARIKSLEYRPPTDLEEAFPEIV